MKIGFIGLGKMGSNMVLNLIDKGNKVVVFNRTLDKIKEMEKKGAIGAFSYEDLCSKLGKDKIIILMVSAGKAVDEVIDNLARYLTKGEVIVDCGNSFYENSIKRHKLLDKKGIGFLDAGTSGGLEGARKGASLTIGGDKEVFKKVEKVFRDLACDNGYAYVGKSGSGHFVKLIHNGIEYALLQSYGEGFEVLKNSEFHLDLNEIARVWNNGSIVKSRILDFTEEVFDKNESLNNIPGKIGGGETGKKAMEIAKKEKVYFGSLKYALKKRKESQRKTSFSTKFVAAVRNKFGGHDINGK
ncbi:decarboxylating 6-phosphogluconate dehydrogenase [Candidatus Pacearchaeota archaeon]|nr:decarboxylating 6-phosphogluconate dehydrogenase [Candidatus Pacearchaeota archaeon]